MISARIIQTCYYYNCIPNQNNLTRHSSHRTCFRKRHIANYIESDRSKSDLINLIGNLLNPDFARSLKLILGNIVSIVHPYLDAHTVEFCHVH